MKPTHERAGGNTSGEVATSARRAVPEWRGATPDTPVPPRVRLRVFEAYGGKCYLSGKKIMAGDKWEIEHIRAMINGGENRESNLAPALKDKHTEKTADDLAEKSKVYRMRAKHLGIYPKSRTRWPKQKFQSSRRTG